jgi:hypothetical protein
MNAAFKSMSDLVADSEDLVVRIGSSEIPQIRALMEPLRRSVDQLHVQLRNRAKRLRMHQNVARTRTELRWVTVVAAAFLTIGTVTWLKYWGKGRP